MSDIFTCYPIEKLVQWILNEEKTGSILGIQKELFFTPKSSDLFRMKRYGQTLETPIGVAAGPQTQLSQNIIAAWLTGARYIELKTIQVLDELEVTKPCIKMEDEGYNCEWSQELKLHQSYDEYLNAWIVLHLLKDKFGWGDADSTGCIFNMSVGYNLDGIKSESVQWFLDKLTDCSQEKAEKIASLAKIYPRIKEINIPDRISDNITVSTMHGCPPDEIEKIGRYFIEERKFNTAIKLNPTLLGPEMLRDILNKKLGFEVTVPDEAFDHDLKYDDGVELIGNLQESAKKSGVEFGLKLTNTLETLNQRGNLPENENTVYMSGRALHAVSINLANRLQEQFKGVLDISFCAGVDCYNVSNVLACDLKPVTVCSDLLKPGGYTRLGQYLEEIDNSIRSQKASSIKTLVCNQGGNSENVNQAALINLSNYAGQVTKSSRYQKSRFPYENVKTNRDLPVFDCTEAPCIPTCPTAQDIPSYLGYTATGNYDEAHRVILETNPLPNLQGQVCDNPCRTKCTRINLDDPLKIREIKRFVAEQSSSLDGITQKAPNGLKAAIIGAGPSGLSCAYFLALEGCAVEVFEAKSMGGGMAAFAIPEFRLDHKRLEVDINHIESLGVKIHYNCNVDKDQFDKLHGDNDFIYIAIGAQSSLKLDIPGEDATGVIDQLEFLSQVRRGTTPDLGKNVVIIGAGNSAMDAARTAKRLVGKEGEVSILYRRTRKEMPADVDEVDEADHEGINLVELMAPEKILIEGGAVSAIECNRMELGDYDASGRRRPVKIENSTEIFKVNTIIPAIGQRIILDFFPGKELIIDPGTFQTQLKKVFSGGDAVRGASTLIEAIGDGRRAAEKIMQHTRELSDSSNDKKRKLETFADYLKRLARREPGYTPPTPDFNSLGFDLITNTLEEEEARLEAARCLSCDLYCSICTTVCPNMANVTVAVDPVELPIQSVKQGKSQIEITEEGKLNIAEPLQILNIGDFCNECGNCTSFCPSNGSPYKTKPRFCLSDDSFAKEEDAHYLKDNTLRVKKGGEESKISLEGDLLKYSDTKVAVELDAKTYQCVDFKFKTVDANPYNLKEVALMGMLLNSLKDNILFESP
ncbi:MAG: putative selenate reductase subunit YgfK [Proteobacteria bacterium]|nr:putative selenate reductase subunit YgfK [Pseudomonadota bacterium]